MNTNKPITGEYINYLKEKYGNLYEFDWYEKDKSVDVLDLNGKYIIALYTMEDCLAFESSIKEKG